MMFNEDSTPVLAKHSKNFSRRDCLCIGVDRMQRNFEPMKPQVEQWQEALIPDVRAKLIIYRAFIDGELEAPSSPMAAVHRRAEAPSSEKQPVSGVRTRTKQNQGDIQNQVKRRGLPAVTVRADKRFASCDQL